MGLRLTQASFQSRFAFSSANICQTPTDCYMLPQALVIMEGQSNTSPVVGKLARSGESNVLWAVVEIKPIWLRGKGRKGLSQDLQEAS